MLKKALITGSAKGIGKAIAFDLAAKGFDIAIHYHHSQTQAQLVQQALLAQGVQAVLIQGDITQAKNAAFLIESAVEALGGLSVLVNNVGNYDAAMPSQTRFHQWQAIMDSNLNATFYLTQTAIPFLKKMPHARVINFACASVQHLMARDENMAYLIAKTGIVIYSKSLAKELAALGITVNVIAPGIADNSFDVDDMLAQLPLKRAATMDDICQAVWFFVNPANDYVTGQVLEISGGWRL